MGGACQAGSHACTHAPDAPFGEDGHGVDLAVAEADVPARVRHAERPERGLLDEVAEPCPLVGGEGEVLQHGGEDEAQTLWWVDRRRDRIRGCLAVDVDVCIAHHSSAGTSATLPEKYSAIRARVVFCRTSFTPVMVCESEYVWATNRCDRSCVCDPTPLHRRARTRDAGRRDVWVPLQRLQERQRRRPQLRRAPRGWWCHGRRHGSACGMCVGRV